ncbi:hypothetical protein M427DRAFT_370824 [Gonapodya prolifera JEL478]|uniref:RBR-type E3 ubiquitin transferase n=1 Tax=Gonapodya prolifera (strain JEL478) TaxID=1344416 RepID=A0A139A9L8_GONPJ|nr:hypothetical protein M427DRAFT_370824 [Gonapodya prolifera JEL478]|eukprot:KXS13374.1 hypothetical protein M427DRAFT_370824 [Gonapodya prolifera JEL478]
MESDGDANQPERSELTDGDIADNRTAQDEEIVALEAIFGDRLRFDPVERAGSILVDVPAFDTPLNVTARSVHEGAPSESCALTRLPPAKLAFRFGPRYPSNACVEFSVEAPWLDNVGRARVEKGMTTLWDGEGRIPCLYAFTDYLQTSTTNDTAHLELKCTDPSSTVAALVMHDRRMAQVEFDERLFLCEVCMEDHRGSTCVRFDPCHHLFCQPCARGYFSSRLEAGDPLAVGLCFNAQCAKIATSKMNESASPVTPVAPNFSFSAGQGTPPTISEPSAKPHRRGRIPRSQIRSILTPTQLADWERLTTLRRSELRADPLWCPHPWCGAPATAVVGVGAAPVGGARGGGDKEKTVQAQVEEELTRKAGIRMARCDYCGFYFCARCGKSWHG